MLKDDVERGGGRDPRLKPWITGMFSRLPYESLKRAEDAYLSFCDDPTPFIAMYAVPGSGDRQQYAGLEIYAMYSTIESVPGAGPVILEEVEKRYGLDASDALQKMHDFNVYTGGGDGSSVEMGVLAFAASMAPAAPSGGVQALVQ